MMRCQLQSNDKRILKDKSCNICCRLRKAGEDIDYSNGGPGNALGGTLAARAGHLSAGNVTVDPSARKYLTFWLLPNGALLAGGDTGLYKFTGQQVANENFATSRLDHKSRGTASRQFGISSR
jgi:hypothetical protein